MKRILALSGGGVRGVVEVAFLEAVEASYKARYGSDVRLCDLFHLVGGTSTGALIATAVALGHPLERIADFYLTRAASFFDRRRWWAMGQASAFDGDALEAELRRDVGDLTLGSEALQTYLAIIIKRLDTGSPWIVNNIPTAPYFDDPADGSYLGNRHYRLSALLRASTAAPTLFDQKLIDILPDGSPGVFIDGGLSPYNDPSLALLKLARLRAFGLEWPTGPDHLFVLSIGAGRHRPQLPAPLAARLSPLRTAYLALRGMLVDTEQHSLAMMEWLGTSRMPAYINSEVGRLDRDSLTGTPAFSFLRLDLPLDEVPLRGAGFDITERELRSLRRIDHAGSITPLYQLTRDYIRATLDLDALLI